MEYVKASDILATAAKLVGGNREATHGDKVKNHTAIAEAWNGYLTARRVWKGDAPLTAEDAAKMMVILKIARTFGGGFNPDDFVDMGGYAGCAGEIRAQAEIVAAENKLKADMAYIARDIRWSDDDGA